MSDKRFTPVEGMSSLLVGDKGVAISAVEACDLLNSQAETIEVLRETIDELKRRIAALEGNNE